MPKYIIIRRDVDTDELAGIDIEWIDADRLYEYRNENSSYQYYVEIVPYNVIVS